MLLLCGRYFHSDGPLKRPVLLAFSVVLLDYSIGHEVLETVYLTT